LKDASAKTRAALPWQPDLPGWFGLRQVHGLRQQHPAQRD